MKGVVIYDINNQEAFVSRNVTLHELIFPYLSNNTSTWDYHVHINPEPTSSSDIINTSDIPLVDNTLNSSHDTSTNQQDSFTNPETTYQIESSQETINHKCEPTT